MGAWVWIVMFIGTLAVLYLVARWANRRPQEGFYYDYEP
jgi:hypothetical protein